jgi:negative regulator of flagellin synthesis FlgM
MNIKGLSEIGRADAAKGARTGAPRGEKRDSAREAPSGEQVTLTATVQRFREAARTAAAEAPVDGARVAVLRAEIAEGSYTVDPKGIAAKLLETELGRNT